MRESVECYIGNGVVLSPEALLKELGELDEKGVDARKRLFLSDGSPLLLPYHVLLDQAREKARGKSAIGTTGRGIGPAYEDKVARRGLRVGDFLNMKNTVSKLEGILDYHNFVLKNYYHHDTCDIAKLSDQLHQWSEDISPMINDVSARLNTLQSQNKKILFEGAQGTLLDIDHGTYPYVTSSNTTAGGVCAGSGVAPTSIDYVLGIVKAYTTRVGGGPFPTELFDDIGDHLGTRGHEFGATTGRSRRCGWFDGVALRRAAQINSLSGLCITKLDVLDGLETLKLATGYRYNGEIIELPPLGADAIEQCEPVYEEMPGWSESTVGIRDLESLPANARAYLDRLEEIVGVPIDIVSTGPERDETIILNHPFG